MVNQIDNVQILEGSTGFVRSIDVANDDLFLSVDLTLQAGAIFESDNIKRGTGNPNGVINGNEGDLFQRIDVGTGELYINTDGTINGWLLVATGVSGAATGIIRIRGSTVETFATIALALATAISGDIVYLGSGSFAESFTIPVGVRLLGAYGPANSRITGSLATGTRITLSDGSIVDGVEVLLPTDATPAITYAGAATCGLRRVLIEGAGVLGVGIRQTGSGTIIARDVGYDTGTCDAAFEVTAGALVLDRVSVGASSVITDLVRASGGGTIYINTLTSIFSATITDGFQCADGTIVGGNIDLRSTVNGIHLTNNSAVVELRGYNLSSSTFSLLVDGGLTDGRLILDNGEINLSGISTPPAWFAQADVQITSQVDNSRTRALLSTSDFVTGLPENGAVASFGEGFLITRGTVVLTTDSTASAVSDGGNFIDVSTEAVSPSGSTFSFQGTAANHTILVGSTLQDGVSFLKHFNWFLQQTTASATNGVYAFEIWDGAAWSEVGVMTTSFEEDYRYANVVFIRANSVENLRFGIVSNTTWALKLINGVTAYWLRVRITSAPSTAPVFERLLISRSRTTINPVGSLEVFGLAQFRETFTLSGNVFGESGGVVDNTVPVGTGGIPTGWNHSVKNSLLNNNGDAIYMQFVLPRGICTAFDLNFNIIYSTSAAGVGTQMILSVLPKEAAGVLVADPTGGLVPSLRTVANTPTLTSVAAQTSTFTPPSTVINKLHNIEQTGFDVSSLYEGDLVFVRLELDNDGTPNTDFQIYAIEISGVRWTGGSKLT